MHPLYDLNLQIFKNAPIFFICSITFFLVIGWLLGRYRLRFNAGNVVVRESLVASIFGLSALVLGFSFSGASNRFDTRIENVRAQAFTIKEAYLSANYLKEQDRNHIQKELIVLLEKRLEVYKDINSMDDIDLGADKLSSLVRQITETMMKAVSNAPIENKQILNETLIPQVRSLTNLFNVGAIKTKSHPPLVVIRFLYILLCAGALLIGYTMVIKSEQDWLLAMMYVVLMGFGLYVILSLEFPNLLMPYDEFNRDLLLLRGRLV